MRPEDSVELGFCDFKLPPVVETHSISSKTQLAPPINVGDNASRIGSDDGLLENQDALKSRTSSMSKVRRVVTNSTALLDYTSMNAWFGERDGPRKYRGWRKAVVAAAIITAVVLLANIILTIVAAARYGSDDGIGVLYTGDCKLVERWDTALHILINILGTCLLSASSFTMQCLSSPTRSETDLAHSKRKSLEVGVPSMKNLFYMHWWKGCLWWALCLSTLPLHLFWNSTIFSTLGANEVNYLVADESFLSGAGYLTPNNSRTLGNPFTVKDVTDPAAFLDGYRAGNYSRLEVLDCVKTYTATFITAHRKFMAVTTPQNGMRMSPGDRFPTFETNLTEWYGDAWTYPSYLSVPSLGYPQPLWNGSSVLAYEGSLNNITGDGAIAARWPCLGWPTEENELAKANCDAEYAIRHLQKNGTWWLRPWDNFKYLDINAAQAYPIDYCLAEDRDVETCQLQYVSNILVIVICCNLVKLACMCATARYLWRKDEPIFATIGDAVSSYMERPDETTEGWCLMDFRTSKSWLNSEAGHDQYARVRKSTETYQRKPVIALFQATSKTRWLIAMCPCMLYFFVGIGFLQLATHTALSSAGSLSAVWKEFGLGKVTNSNLLHVSEGSASKNLISSILIANSFQLALSVTYFLFNSLWTAQCSAIEWASYITRRKPLRVTWPRGQQRSTYYLNLPYRYGIPLTVMLALLHFLISQSIFLARVQYYNADGSLSDGFISDAAYSPLGILVTLCVALVLLLGIVGHGFRKIDNRMPVHGNSSVVISALCHSTRGQYRNDEGVLLEHPLEDMAERTVMWGVVQRPSEDFVFKDSVLVNVDEQQVAGHCAFSAGLVKLPETGKRYK